MGNVKRETADVADVKRETADAADVKKYAIDKDILKTNLPPAV